MSSLTHFTGWLLDLYPTSDGMVLWAVDEQGTAHRLVDSFAMSFFVAGERSALHSMCQFLAHSPDAKLKKTRRYDLLQGIEIELLQIIARTPLAYSALFRQVFQRWPNLSYYNSDLDPAVIYGSERGVFPLATCSFEVQGNRVTALSTTDSPWNLDYALPPFKTITIHLASPGRNPNHGYRSPLEISWQKETCQCTWDNPTSLLKTLAAIMVETDPDLILSAWGDNFLLPEIMRLSDEHGIPIRWNRDDSVSPVRKKQRSYFSYGRIVFRAPSIKLFGRLHIDARTSFLADDYGLTGMCELARITGQPLQQTVRTSTGTGISAMQVAEAYRHDWLIPFRKRQPEEFKTALDLVRSDKGGLTFQPEAGLYDDVLELDYSSLYPSIMVKFNLSPETVLKECPLCGSPAVPEIGYPVCRCRPGLVPLTLKPIIERRLALKDRAHSLPNGTKRDIYQHRQKALKWLLVTCFGYLGYKNARFGRIEAHEATTAYGREMLLRAKEVAELHGYRFLHALTDSLWVQKSGATMAEHKKLAEEIGQAAGMRIEIEGVYRWLVFLPSRQNAQLSVANRYYGLFETGELKVRGIEMRRHDTVAFVRDAQQEMLAFLSGAGNATEYKKLIDDVLALARAQLACLRRGDIDPGSLIVSANLSHAPSEYRANLPISIAARELEARGIHLSPGERIDYVLTTGGGARPCDMWSAADRYDYKRYEELYVRMLETLCAPAGMGRIIIREHLSEAFQLRLPGIPARYLPRSPIITA